ncbi:helix-turn-helix domain-containing protein [Sediminibacterium sp.]|uniref:helix-turn-helix domain-containing protein n=1 Tax=Sediminibacterium sp. TaxID=1917865 RepID=UPI003F72E4DE
MVSLRCKLIVKEILQTSDIPYQRIDLGEVLMTYPIDQEKIEDFRIRLFKYGLELIDDKKSIIISQIKGVIIEMIHYSEDEPELNFSTFLSDKLSYNYTYLSNLFSEIQGSTIEQFIILHKIERVKELIIYNELNLTEIAWKLHYSSVAHLSNQFKKITGLTPSFFKAMANKKREVLEKL